MWLFIIFLVSGLARQFASFLILIAASTITSLLSRPVRFVIPATLLSAGFFAYGLMSSTSHLAGVEQFQSVLGRRGSGNNLVLRGWISSYPTQVGGKTVFNLRTEIRGRDVTLHVKTTLPAARYGRRLLIRKWKPDRKLAYENGATKVKLRSGQAVAGGIIAGASDVSLLGGSEGSLIKRRIFFPLHLRFRNAILRSMGRDAAYPIAVFLGEKSYIGARDRRLITRLGINHLFALSGFHLGIIVIAVLIVLRICRSSGRIAVLLVLTVYVGIVGDIKSLQRAYAMLALSMLASGSQRIVEPLDVLESSMLLLLMLDPFSIYSISFQLSLAATFGIILFSGRIGSQKGFMFLPRPLRYIFISAMVSVSAQLFTAPIVLWHFGKISLVTPITTMIFMPLIACILCTTGICVLGSFGLPWVGEAGFWILGKLSSLMQSMMHGAGALVPAPLALKPPVFLLYYSGLILLFSRCRHRWKVLGTVLVLSSVIIRKVLPGMANIIF